MATMTSKQFCERLHGMYRLLSRNEFGYVRCSNDSFSCGHRKENTVLTNALIKCLR